MKEENNFIIGTFDCENSRYYLIPDKKTSDGKNGENNEKYALKPLANVEVYSDISSLQSSLKDEKTIYFIYWPFECYGLISEIKNKDLIEKKWYAQVKSLIELKLKHSKKIKLINGFRLISSVDSYSEILDRREKIKISDAQLVKMLYLRVKHLENPENYTLRKTLEALDENGLGNDPLIENSSRIHEVSEEIIRQYEDYQIAIKSYSEIKASNSSLLKQLSVVQKHVENQYLDFQKKIKAECDNSSKIKTKYRNIRNILQNEVIHYKSRTLLLDAKFRKLKSSRTWKLIDKIQAFSKILKRRNFGNDLKALSESKYFDSEWYLEKNSDVKQSGIDPAMHYLNYGYLEGREPSKIFEGNWYVIENEDVAREGYNPLLHYIRYGEAEGRLPRRPLNNNANKYKGQK